MVLAIIIACEIGFWVLIALGLIARYVLRWKRTGTILLALTPVVDVVLLVATALDLRAGATATIMHGIAAIYLGFSIAYGHKMIGWADVRFAHRFAGGPAPVKRYGRLYAAESWRDVLRTTVAVGVAFAVLMILSAVAGDPARTQALGDLNRILMLIWGADVLWAVGYTVWPKPQPVTAQ